MQTPPGGVPPRTPVDSEGAGEPSLVRGGPFYRAQEAVRLVSPERWNLRRRIVVAVGIGWLPLFLITLLSNPHSLVSLLTDYTINVRLLIAVPILLIGQAVMDNTFRTIVRHIRNAELLPAPEEAKMDHTIARLIRFRDSIVPEIIILVAAYGHFLSTLKLRLVTAEPWAVRGSGSAFHLSPAAWYYALVGQLVYQFLLGISLWKWFLWICFLFRLSKFDLQLIPTHPDQHAGIGFLGMSPMAIAPTMFVTAGAIGSSWRIEILKHTAHLMDFKLEAVILLLVVLVLAMGPLALFVPRLSKLRRHGIFQYGILGQRLSTEFHNKWIQNPEGHEEELINAPEISTLTDYSTTYENVEKLQPFPLDKGALIALVLAIAVPMLPTVLAEVPFITVLKDLLAAVK